MKILKIKKTISKLNSIEYPFYYINFIIYIYINKKKKKKIINF